MDGATQPQPVSFRLHALTGLAAATVMVAGAVVGGAAYVSHSPGAWFFGTPGGPIGSVAADSLVPPLGASAAVYAGMAVLVLTWWRMLQKVHRYPGLPVYRIVLVMALWALPILLAPPLFSQDVFSYAGQGEMVSHHISPYAFGTGVLGATPFSLLSGPLWANSPSPYGPVFLVLDGLATVASGHHILADLVLLRLLAVAGVALMVVSLPTLARSVGRDPAAGVLLGAGSPIALVTLIGGEHNDALMIGLLVAGLAVARRVGPVPGIVLCALAAGVKAPAVLGIVFIGWNWTGPLGRVSQRMWRTVASLAAGGAVLSVVSYLSGIGWGWVRALMVTDKVGTGVSPVNLVVEGLVGLAGGSTYSALHAGAVVFGLLVAGVAGVWLLWRSPSVGMVTALGLTLLVLALASPVMWAWYLAWGLVVLAPVAGGRLRRIVVGLVAAESMVGIVAGTGAIQRVWGSSVSSDLLLVAGVGVALLAATALLRRDPTYDGWPWFPWSDAHLPWSGQRAVHPFGVIVTAILRPQSRQ